MYLYDVLSFTPTDFTIKETGTMESAQTKNAAELQNAKSSIKVPANGRISQNSSNVNTSSKKDTRKGNKTKSNDTKHSLDEIRDEPEKMDALDDINSDSYEDRYDDLFFEDEDGSISLNTDAVELARHKKLDKTEREYFKEHKELISPKPKLSPAEQKELAEEMAFINSLI